MDIVPSFSGEVIHGKLIHDSPMRVSRWLAQLEGKKIRYSFRIYRDKSSSKQRRYYFGVLIKILGLYLGYEKDEIHEICKFKFLRVIDEKGFEYVRSTEDLDTKEREEYHENIRKWGGSMEPPCYLPEPNEVEFDY